MPYELRIPGSSPTQFATEQEAVATARVALQDDPNAEPEIFDTDTGKPCAPAASKSWREELATRVGF